MQTEEESFQLQALEIQEPDENFDPEKQPQNGEEYLMHMLYERKRCPAIVTKRSAKIKSDVCNNIEMVASPPLPPHKCLLPTPEWRNVQVKSFQEARQRVTTLRGELDAQHYDQKVEPPLTTDAAKWLQFCQQQQPLLSTLLRLSQNDLELLLELLCKWLQPEQESSDEPSTSASAQPFDLWRDTWLARWLYATLVCLHLPLEPHVFSTLRCIGRAAVLHRNMLQETELERAAPYNLIITLIAQVFAQSDFAVYL
ncbi:protein Gemin2 [Drosophila sulfurigaster albostrigata]|uniref:protein Gemin2 n=1 Tax=Drosophila sulfurigaster albostrigata TaxID=89887 RepID=UPI002D21985D|nr:protein Gemin2 [Drosophila sulfurigaster albostrigata]